MTATAIIGMMEKMPLQEVVRINSAAAELITKKVVATSSSPSVSTKGHSRKGLVKDAVMEYMNKQDLQARKNTDRR